MRGYGSLYDGSGALLSRSWLQAESQLTATTRASASRTEDSARRAPHASGLAPHEEQPCGPGTGCGWVERWGRQLFRAAGKLELSRNLGSVSSPLLVDVVSGVRVCA
jgi:hypothetical protein